MRNTFTVLLGTQEGQRQLRRPGRRWMDHVTMDIKEIHLEYEGVEWINLAEDRVPIANSGNFGSTEE